MNDKFKSMLNASNELEKVTETAERLMREDPAAARAFAENLGLARRSARPSAAPAQIVRRAANDYRIARADLIGQMPDLIHDLQCLADTLEGATDLNEQLAALVRSALDDEDLVNALTVRIEKMKDRKAALEQRAQKKREIALHYMGDLDIKNITTDDVTITRKRVPPSVVIYDAAAIPPKFIKTKVTQAPDKIQIKESLDQGHAVPGCRLSNGGETLQVKT